MQKYEGVILCWIPETDALPCIDWNWNWKMFSGVLLLALKAFRVLMDHSLVSLSTIIPGVNIWFHSW